MTANNTIIIPRILSWVYESYFADYAPMVSEISVWFLKNKRHLGTLEAVRLMKLYRLAVTRALSGNPLVGKGIRLDRNGYPYLLNPRLRRLLANNDAQAIRATLTALSWSRSELGGSKLDLRPITTPSDSSSQAIDLIMDMAQEFLDHFKIKPHSVTASTLTVEDFNTGLTVKQWLDSVPFYWSTKKGPNGPAMQTATSDYQLLPDWLKANLVILEPRLQEIFAVYDSSPAILEYYNTLMKNEKRTSYLRKLSVKDDKETKSRVFAILDY